MRNIFYKMSETKLTVTIQHGEPIELLDFTKSFFSLGQQYRRHTSGEFSTDSKLYVKEVRNGSTVLEFIEQTKTWLLPLAADINTLVEFTKFIKRSYSYLLGKKIDQEPKFSIADLENLKSILEPVVNNDNSTTINFNVTINGISADSFTASKIEAGAIQNEINKELKERKVSTERIYEKVVYYYYAAKDEIQNETSWERGKIESITSQAVKVVFDNEDLKVQMIHPSKGSIFDIAYIVDVRVETIEGRPVLYKILKIHDYLPREGRQLKIE